jgi:3-oxoacyl-[acyl-carrier-protein] synthase II
MASTSAHRRVVITGLGVVSPLGNSPQALWDALVAGRSGVAPLVNLPPIDGRVTFAGECRDFTGEIDDFGELDKDLKKSIRKALKMMCRESMMAVAAAQQAVIDGGFAGANSAGPMDPDGSGVVFGSDYMLSPPEICSPMLVGDRGFDFGQWGREGSRDNPLWMLSTCPICPAATSRSSMTCAGRTTRSRCARRRG